jgi:hypothetical protein
VGYPPVRNQTQLLRNCFRAKHVTSVIVDKRDAATWVPALDRIARAKDVGGVLLYRVGGVGAPGC